MLHVTGYSVGSVFATCAWLSPLALFALFRFSFFARRSILLVSLPKPPLESRSYRECVWGMHGTSRPVSVSESADRWGGAGWRVLGSEVRSLRAHRTTPLVQRTSRLAWRPNAKPVRLYSACDPTIQPVLRAPPRVSPHKRWQTGPGIDQASCLQGRRARA